MVLVCRRCSPSLRSSIKMRDYSPTVPASSSALPPQAGFTYTRTHTCRRLLQVGPHAAPRSTERLPKQHDVHGTERAVSPSPAPPRGWQGPADPEADPEAAPPRACPQGPGPPARPRGGRPQHLAHRPSLRRTYGPPLSPSQTPPRDRRPPAEARLGPRQRPPRPPLPHAA